MRLVKLALFLALAALALAAPVPDDDFYDYNYDDDDDADWEEARRPALPFSIFRDLSPRRAARGQRRPSACSWAVVHCCNNDDRWGSRAGCFAQLGCSGAWFTDICTPSIKRNTFETVFNSVRND